MKTRQNPLSKFESFMQRIVETPFAFIFPSKLQPIQVARKLEGAMEDNIYLPGEGRRLAPNVYDIYISIKDHQQLASSESMLRRDWQNHLIDVARHRHYTLRSEPLLRLHADSKLRTGVVYVEAKHESDAEGGIMATQALSAEQLAQLRSQVPAAQQLPGMSNPGVSSPNQAGTSAVSNASQFSAAPGSSSQLSAPVAVPPARLQIRSPQGMQQVFRIDKPVINIGRQLSNDIIVEDKRVSRYHAQIKYQQNGEFTIFDLGSTNGITVNGTPHLRQHTFRHGDRFTIGSYDFNFERR